MEVMQKLAEISPCPRCGGQPLLFINIANNEHHLECPPCRFRMWGTSSAQEAVQAWEHLPRDPPQTE